MRSVALVIVAAVLAACSSGGSGPTGSGNPSPSGQSVSVPVGGEAVVPGTQVTIRFHEVTEDSRCPSNVVCVWEGNGQVALTLSTPSGAREVLLNTTSEPRRIEFAGSRITLASLAPYPSGEPVDPGAYVATFEVEPD
jgi:hypothetical protein